MDTYESIWTGEEIDAGIQRSKDNALAISNEEESRIAADTELQNKITTVENRIDGKIEVWFPAYIPTLENAPANEWTTDALKNEHLGNLAYNVEPGGSKEGAIYRFALVEGIYKWLEIPDTDSVLAIQLATLAQNTADSKSTVWIDKPTKYKRGDLWKLGAQTTLEGVIYSKGDILISSATSDTFVSSHWSKFYVVSVGGVNLARDSNNPDNFIPIEGAVLTSSVVSEFGFDDANRLISSGGASTLKTIYTYGVPDNGNTVSESIYFKNNGASDVIVTSNLGSKSLTVESGESIRIKFEGIVGNGAGYLHFQIRTLVVEDNLDVTWSRIKVENGNVCTDWTPAQGIALMEIEYEDGSFESINIVTAI